MRDELLGLDPDDYDVATDARPEQVRGLFPRVSEVGASFGVMLIRRRNATVEVATFRREGVYSDKRRPDAVEYADAEADARRRDFTINALFLDPLAPSEAPQERAAESQSAAQGLAPPRGRVIDFVAGLADLRRGLIRAVGDPDARLAEDHLRGLRAARIAARLNFSIDDETAAAIRRHARELAGVSRERVGDEVRRMLEPASRRRAAPLIESLLLARPALGDAIGPDAPAPTPTLNALDEAAGAMTALAAWALDRTDAKPGLSAPPSEARIEAIARALRSALCLSNDERDALAAALRGLRTLHEAWDEMAIAAKKRSAASAWFEEALRLLAARDAARARRVDDEARSLCATPSGLSPQPLLTGDDVAALAGGPGPIVGRTLRAVYDAQLEERIATRDEAIALARRLVAESQRPRSQRADSV